MTPAATPPGPVRLPTLDHLVAFNYAVRGLDERFPEPDDIQRVARALESVRALIDPVETAAKLAFRIARAQGFAEGNKRTALLAARWTLDRNGCDGARLLPEDDRPFADLLIAASQGIDVSARFGELLASRMEPATRDLSAGQSRSRPSGRDVGAGIER